MRLGSLITEWTVFSAMVGVAVVVLFAPIAMAENQGLGTKDDTLGSWFTEPVAVRNVQPLPGEEVTILRTFKIKKGTYAEFYRRSETEIWPFFEKIGARVVGMWQVDPGAIDDSIVRDYDEAVLLTRYASVEHWRASREGVALGGNGPDAQALAAAHRYRQSVTIETTFRVLRGSLAENGPYFMPAVSPDGD